MLSETAGLPLGLGFCARMPDSVSYVIFEVSLLLLYHFDGSLHSRDAADAGCREEQMALWPLERELPLSCSTRLDVFEMSQHLD